MSFEIFAVDHVGLFVRNREAVERFYVDDLGRGVLAPDLVPRVDR